MIKKIIIYTDGACSGNPGPGGWAALLRYGLVEKVISGGKDLTTNNVMEMTAVIEALKILKEKCNIDIYTDSKYVMDGIMKWLKNWQKNNWITSAKKAVANKDLWIEMNSLMLKHNVTFHWVKGHGLDEFNNRVDKIARDEAKKFKHIPSN